MSGSSNVKKAGTFKLAPTGSGLESKKASSDMAGTTTAKAAPAAPTVKRAVKAKIVEEEQPEEEEQPDIPEEELETPKTATKSEKKPRAPKATTKKTEKTEEPKKAEAKAEKTEKAEKPKAARTKAGSAAPTPETRRIKKEKREPKPKTAAPKKKASPSFEEILTKALSELTYIRANGESGLLKTTGVPMHLARADNVAVYDGNLRLFGSEEDIEKFLAKPGVAEVYSAKGIDTEDKSKIISKSNLATLNDPNNKSSWFYTELKESREMRKNKSTQGDSKTFHTMITDLADVTNRSHAKNTDPLSRTKARLDEAQRFGKVLDVSGFDPEHWKGIKQIEKPGEKSATLVMKSIAICAKTEEQLTRFLDAYYHSEDDKEMLMNMRDEAKDLAELKA